MQLPKTQKILISIIVAVVVLLGMYIFIDRKSKEQNQPSNTNISTSTGQISTTTISGTQIKINGGRGYTVERVSLNQGAGVPKPIPDLNRISVATYGATITPEAKSVADVAIKSLQASLRKNPAVFSSWLDLGINQKMAGDYDGAVISWTYAGKLAPSDYISLGNLGNIYAYYLRDNIKAEAYYKKAISNGPAQVILYIQLAEIYRDLFSDEVKARAIVDQGLLQIPNDPNLLQLKASFQ